MKRKLKVISDDIIPVKPMSGLPSGNLFYMDIKLDTRSMEFVLKNSIETLIKRILWKHCGDERFKPFSLVDWETGQIDLKYDPKFTDENFYLSLR